MPGFAAAVQAGQAFVSFGVQDNTAIGLRRIAARFRQFGASLQVAGAQLFAGGLIAAAPLAMAFRAFNDLDESLSFLGAVTKDVDGSFATLEATILRLGRTTSFTAKEVAEGAIELGRAGFSQGEINNSIGDVLNLARATRTGLAESANIAAIAMRAFNLESQDMTWIVDTLTGAVNTSAQTLEDFSEGFKLAAPLAKNTGHEINELAAYLAVLADSGIRGSIAGTGIRRALINITNAANAEKVKKYIGDIRDSSGQLKPLIVLLQQLESRTASLDAVARTAVYADIFGRGANSAIVLANSLDEGTAVAQGFANAYEEQVDQIENGKSAADTAEEAMGRLWGAVVELTSAFEGLKIAIINAMGQELEDSIDAVKTMIGGITEFIQTNREFVVTWAKIALGVLAAGAVLVPLGAVFIVLGTAISTLLGLLGSFVTVAGFLIGIVTTLGGYLWAAGGAVISLGGSLWGVIGATSAAIDSFFLFAGWIGGVQGAAIGLGGILGGGLGIGLLIGVLTEATRFLQDLGTAFVTIISEAITPFTTALSDIGAAFRRSWSVVVDLLKNGEIEGAMQIVGLEIMYIWQRFLINLQSAWESLWAGMWYPFAALGERLYDYWLDFKYFILNIFDEIAQGLNFITLGLVGNAEELERSAVDKLSQDTNFAEQALNDPRQKAEKKLQELAAKTGAMYEQIWKDSQDRIDQRAAAAEEQARIDEESAGRQSKLDEKNRGDLQRLETDREKAAQAQKRRDREIALNGLQLRRQKILNDIAAAEAAGFNFQQLTSLPSGADIRTAAGFQNLLPLANQVTDSIAKVETAVREEMLKMQELQQRLIEIDNNIYKKQQEEDESETIFEDGRASSDMHF